MKPLPEKLKSQMHGSMMMLPNLTAGNFNDLIDHLTDYEAEQDRRLTELDNRIQDISVNQLERKRGKRCPEEDFGFEPKDQPKRWRAGYGYTYFRVSATGDIGTACEHNDEYDNYQYAIGNYHQTREAAEAYKAKLLSDNQQ